MNGKIVLLVASCILSIASSVSAQNASNPVTIGSKIDTEGTVLGKMIVQLLSANGIPVVDKVGFGTTDLVRKAIAAKELDLYVEYTGNGAFFFQGTDPTVWKSERMGYETVKRLDLEKNDIVWLTPAPANNTWAIAARKDLADKEKLATLEDFARYVRRGGKAKLAASEEFISSAAALPAFQAAYGFKLANDQLLSFSGGNTALTEQAASQGSNGVNFAMAYGTDGSLAALGLTELATHTAPASRGGCRVNVPTGDGRGRSEAVALRGGWGGYTALGPFQAPLAAIRWVWSFRRLWVAAANRHSERTAARPRRWKRSNPRLNLSWPKTGSTVAIRFR